MPLDLFKSIIDELSSLTYMPRFIHFTGLGEPLLHPSLVTMIQYIKKSGHFVGFNSNFVKVSQNMITQLVKEEFELLVISFDGATKETFEKIRVGASYEKVLKNIKLLIRTKKEQKTQKPRVALSATISEENAMEIKQIVKLAEKIEVDLVSFYRSLVPGREHWKKKLNISQIWKNLPKSRINIEAKAIPTNKPYRCLALVGSYITYDGKILPCTSIYQLIPRTQYSKFEFGDLKKDTFSNIWFSKSYRQFRKRLTIGNFPLICNYCSAARAI